MKTYNLLTGILAGAALIVSFDACKPRTTGSAVSGDAAQAVYVPPGQYDEF